MIRTWLLDRNITPYIPVLDRKAQTDGKMTRDAFTYDAERDVFTCPQGHDLPLCSVNAETRVKRYKAKALAMQGVPIAIQMHGCTLPDGDPVYRRGGPPDCPRSGKD